MSFSQQLCVDSQCSLQQKLINNTIELFEHSKHKLTNLDEVREELNKISHPIRQVLKLQSNDQILFDIDKQKDKIQNIIITYLDSTVKTLKKSVTTTSTETAEFKDFHEALFSEIKICQKQEALSRFIYKMNSQYIKKFLNKVIRVRQEPFKILKDLEDKILDLSQTEMVVPQEVKKIKISTKNTNIKRFKTTTKNELDLLKQLEEHDKSINELDVDLMGQTITRQELMIPNEIFRTIGSFLTLSSLKVTMSSTNVQDVSELSRSISMLIDLTSLQLSLGNTKIQKLSELGDSLSHLRNLKKLELSLWSTSVGDIENIGKGIGSIKGLRTLEIQLGNTFVSDISELGKGLGENKNLKQLSLNLEFTKVADITDLGWAIFTLKNLEEFELDLVDTCVNARIRKNFFNLQQFLNEWKQLNLKGT